MSNNSDQNIADSEKKDYLLFGKYLYGAEKSKNPIKWIILEKYNDGTALLISKYGLDVRKYNNFSEDVTWETCSLRNWLNNDFYNTAFNEYEKQEIITANIVNDDNVEFGTDGGNNTEDNVFLLSIAEEARLIDAEIMKTEVTPYAKAKAEGKEPAWTNDDGYCWWWLRSPGCRLDTAASIFAGDFVETDGYPVNFKNGAVRACIRVSLTGARILSRLYNEKKDPDNPLVQKEIGDYYFNGKETNVDYKKACSWYTRAAKQGLAEARVIIAYICASMGTGKTREDGIKTLHNEAGKGNPVAQNFMGKVCYQEKHYKEALKWFLLPKEQDDVDAQISIADIYYYGCDGVRKNPAESLKWYQKAAEQGNINAQIKLGHIYYYGFGNIQKDYKKALDYYHKPAEMGDLTSQTNLGNIYYHGFGNVQKDYKKALNYYLKPAEMGNPGPQLYIGDIYYYGLGNVPKNLEDAMYWYHKSASKGNSEAQLNLGNIYYEKQNYAEALKWYLKVAEIIDHKAQVNIGNIYYDGLGGVAKDSEKAFEWYQKAALQGNTESFIKLGDIYYQKRDYKNAFICYKKVAEGEYNERVWKILGDMYYSGNGGVTDYGEARKYYYYPAQKANDVEAQYRLGDIYYSWSKNIAEATFWYQKAAEQENEYAQIQLGNIYYSEKNYSEALKWYTRPKEQNDPVIQNKIGNIYYIEKKYSEALKWYTIPMEQNDPEIQYRIGYIYYKGLDTRDFSQAYKWYYKAAMLGNAKAQFALCKMCYDGECSDSSTSAFNWCRMAAEQGYPIAQTVLGMFYFDGEGVSKDKNKGKEWLEKAADQGEEYAIEFLKKINSPLYKILNFAGDIFSSFNKS